MKKRVFAALITVCLLFSVLSCVASAALDITVGEIPVVVRVCPGQAINIEMPEFDVYSQGWQIKTVDGVWIPYDMSPLTEADDGKEIRYFVANEIGEFEYSDNTCTLIVEHNPDGEYKYDGMYHWRECQDCDGQVDKEGHTTLGSDATSEDKVCKVCGQVRTSQYTGLLAFWNWLMNDLLAVIMSLF